MKNTNPLDVISEALDKMPKEEQVKFLPALKELNRMLRLNNEGIQRENAFTAHFTNVVGVVFGVLAAFTRAQDQEWTGPESIDSQHAFDFARRPRSKLLDVRRPHGRLK